MVKSLLLAALLACCWLPQVGMAATTVKTAAGSCANYDFSSFRQGEKLQWNESARVLRHNAPLYNKVGDSKPAATVAFNQRLELLSDKGERLQVKGYNSVTGWMNKSDLLCRSLPLQDDTGLEKKFFIRTATVARTATHNEPAVRVHPDPEMSDCSGSGSSGQEECQRSASRFQMYFVFDEREHSLLLAERYRLGDAGGLPG
ncbi:MAG: hypothetical protein HQL60_08660, partial [Magnetococcales bacterium]|nr:hypothetical protein [Magnetococcales bacterium]